MPPEEEFIEAVANIIVATLMCSATCCVSSVLIGIPIMIFGGLTRIRDYLDDRRAVRDMRRYFRRERDKDKYPPYPPR